MRNNKSVVLCLSMALVCAVLCVSAFNASTQLGDVSDTNSRDGSEPIDKFTTSFSLTDRRGEAKQVHQALRFQVRELRTRLDFMVFDKERKDIQNALIEVLQKQVNLAPFSSGPWRDLVFLQSEQAITDSDYQVLFNVSKRLSKWNVNERVVLLNRCVNDYQKLNSISPALCADLLANIPMQDNLRRLSNSIGVEYSRLLLFFEQLKVLHQDQTPSVDSR